MPGGWITLGSTPIESTGSNTYSNRHSTRAGSIVGLQYDWRMYAESRCDTRWALRLFCTYTPSIIINQESQIYLDIYHSTFGTPSLVDGLPMVRQREREREREICMCIYIYHGICLCIGRDLIVKPQNLSRPDRSCSRGVPFDWCTACQRLWRMSRPCWSAISEDASASISLRGLGMLPKMLEIRNIDNCRLLQLQICVRVCVCVRERAVFRTM